MTKYYDINPNNNPLFAIEDIEHVEPESVSPFGRYELEIERLISVTSKTSREINVAKAQMARFNTPAHIAEYESLINKRNKLVAEMKKVKAALKLAKAILKN